ncbi:hypothetical protein GCM10009850_115300 [Nonomuraea monospora]|uniref:Uncharacterized protein n=1 Tax=Nonomuraea monospora TaxID=568818 RepID=A0ABN3D2K5_9ACTN
MIGSGTPSADARLRVSGAITRRFGRCRAPSLAGSNRREVNAVLDMVVVRSLMFAGQ